MDAMGDVPRGPNTPSSGAAQDLDPFAAALMRLKRRGCCVLVTGQVDERVRAAQSCRLFGQSNESRRRVLVLTEGTPSLTAQYLPDDITPAHSSVTKLDYTNEIRDAATADPSPQPRPTATGSEESAPMTDLGTSLYDPIADAVRTDSPSPGELRLGIATLGALIDTDGLTASRAFVRAVRGDVLAVHGMGHFHFPGEPDTETFAALRPLIDIHIELRNLNGVPEHRWHLLEAGHSTGWIRL